MFQRDLDGLRRCIRFKCGNQIVVLVSSRRDALLILFGPVLIEGLADAGVGRGLAVGVVAALSEEDARTGCGCANAGCRAGA